jgi:hypothetical protein
MLQQLIASDKTDIGRADVWGGGRTAIDIRVRRTHLYEDSFDALSETNGLFCSLKQDKICIILKY